MSETAVNLLLVEDNKADARLVQAWLEETSAPPARCHHVSHLRDAVAALQDGQFDAVLLDMSLPDSDGIDNVDRIREVADDLPIVVLTGRDDDALGLTVLQHGAQDYLVKGRHTGEHVNRSVRYAIERKRLEEELVRLAHYDTVTGLANRVRFIDRLDHAVARATRRREGLAVLYLDLDGFKAVNDSYGHAVGDWLLRRVGERLTDCVRDEDTVARLGGDEFAVLIEEIDTQQDAITVANKLLTGVGTPYQYRDLSICVGASIGIAPFPAAGRDVETLMKHADVAMYRSKQDGRHNYQCFTQQMDLENHRRQQTEQALSRALHAGEFQLYFQPRVSAVGYQIVGLEALLRWCDNGAMKLPHSFIPVLERTGLIGDVGDWVVESVCRQIRQWREDGYDVPVVSINLSGRQLQDSRLPKRLGELLSRYDVKPEALEFEITETLLLGDDDTVKTVLLALRQLGCRIAIDDFGAGYCSFAYLRDYTVDVIKIDQSFVAGISEGSREALLLGGIIRLARDLSLKVVVEGIENAAAVTVLNRFSPDEFQGFLFYTPMDAAAVAKLLRLSNGTGQPGILINRH